MNAGSSCAVPRLPSGRRVAAHWPAWPLASAVRQVTGALPSAPNVSEGRCATVPGTDRVTAVAGDHGPARAGTGAAACTVATHVAGAAPATIGRLQRAALVEVAPKFATIGARNRLRAHAPSHVQVRLDARQLRRAPHARRHLDAPRAAT